MMLDRKQFKNLLRHKRLGLALLCSALLSACANTVTVKSDVPSPLVERLPISAKMSYTDTFKEYTYQETEKGRSLKSLDFSTAQVDMFDRIFGRLLNLVSSEEPTDLTIEPEILDFQYTAPRETKLKLYEVWLKYRLKLTGRDDNKLADWTIKGYGKTPTGTLTSASSAFNAATNVALRDVGAQLSIRLPNQSAIKGLLDVPDASEEQPDNPEAEDQKPIEQELAEVASESQNSAAAEVDESDGEE